MSLIRLRGAWLALCCLCLFACSTAPHNTARNLPAIKPAAQAVPPLREPVDVFGETAVAMSFSGGGIRAAAFSFGALQGLDALPLDGQRALLDELSFISSVSGGSMTAAYYGLHGKDTLNSFRSVLLKDGEADLRFSLVNPLNIARLMAGGLNDRQDLQRWLDADVFRGASYADMFRRGKPIVMVNATNVYHRIAFPFTQRAFDLLCSDLASYPVADAVAASMAVPLFFAPVVLEKHPDACVTALPEVSTRGNDAHSLLALAVKKGVQDIRDAGKGRYIKLIDGGVTDNYGLTSIMQSRLLRGAPYGPLTETDAVRTRKMLFVVVDAGQSPSGDWNQRESGPSGVELASAAIDSAIDTNVRMSYDNFVPMMKQWQRDVIDYRCALPAARQQALAAARPGWRCDDVEFVVTRVSFDDLGAERSARLNAIPTRLSLPEAQVDQLIAAGREAVMHSAVVQRFVAATRAAPAAR
ncbi:patatin-like phospholipase family protein [Chitinimonas sp.]|uniref:patatin-like phospholipase family protein n=1 Tax=Chitinimonas sp. TaxID=1934313 RepID=UPI0035ADF493